MQKPHLPELIFFFILLAGSALGAYFVLAPYFTALFLGVVLAIVMRPIYNRIHIKLPGKPGLAAGVTTLLAILVVLLPLAFAGLLLANEITNYSLALRENSADLKNYVQHFSERVHSIAPSVEINLDPATYLSKLTNYAGENISSFASGLMTLLVDVTLMLVSLYFFLRDGHKLYAFALDWSPLPDKYDRTIISRVGGAITAVVKGTLLTALAQGVIGGIGYAIFSVPNPVLWGAITVLAALVPVVGTAIVTVPITVYVYVHSGPVLGLGMLLWAFIPVSMVENILRPILIRGGLPIHSFIILLSVIGGLSVFGPVGFIGGPVVLALFFALLDIYPEIVRGKLDESAPVGDSID